MEDQLEQFIRQNREGFDGPGPSEKVWHKVNGSFPARPMGIIRFPWNAMGWAAAVVFMALSAYLYSRPMTDVPEYNGKAMRGFGEVEGFYSQQIAEKVALIGHFETDDDFAHSFKQLEAMYLELREEMKVRPSEKVRNALELNLLVRINMLNRQLDNLEKSKEGEKKKEKSL